MPPGSTVSPEWGPVYNSGRLVAQEGMQVNRETSQT